MTIRVYNTLSKTKEPFEPVQPGRVGIYLCGPTVYKEAHIGHMVGPVIFDTIKRYLAYNGYEVIWVVNITDVDDKLIAESRRRGIATEQVATEMTMDYCANLLELGVDQITHLPRATEHITEILELIGRLIDSGHAYASAGDVFFDVAKDPEYGKLSNRSPDEQQGEGGGAASKKRSPGDFALWKAAKPGEPSWESPWGDGRPGWHIECSAMSRQLLGESFDIHGGGLDLMFPHHENELAQSECCHGKPMAKYWMHNGLLRAGEAGKIGGRAERENEKSGGDHASTESSPTAKMSRSDGAGGLRGLILRQGGEKIRFFLLRTHYRSTIVFSEEGVEEAGAALDKFYHFFERYERITGQSYYLTGPDDDRKTITRRESGAFDAAGCPLLTETANLRSRFLEKMDDDFNSGAAVSDLFVLLGELNRFADQRDLEDSARRQAADLQSFGRAVETLRELATILGLFVREMRNKSGGADNEDLVERLVQLLIEVRADARQNKNFSIGDKIRDDLAAAEITLEDRKQGTTWRHGK